MPTQLSKAQARRERALQRQREQFPQIRARYLQHRLRGHAYMNHWIYRGEEHARAQRAHHEELYFTALDQLQVTHTPTDTHSIAVLHPNFHTRIANIIEAEGSVRIRLINGQYFIITYNTAASFAGTVKRYHLFHCDANDQVLHHSQYHPDLKAVRNRALPILQAIMPEAVPKVTDH